jgi:hypothetical protein
MKIVFYKTTYAIVPIPLLKIYNNYKSVNHKLCHATL